MCLEYPADPAFTRPHFLRARSHSYLNLPKDTKPSLFHPVYLNSRSSTMSSAATPPFTSLPLSPAGPRGNAWGLFSSQSTTSSSQSPDQLGTLNRLTPETTLSASKEIIHGIRISTDLPLDKPLTPCFGRQKFEHKIVHKNPRTVNDDVLVFNTQSASQWDGFRHFGECDK